LTKTVDLKKYSPFKVSFDQPRIVALNQKGDKGILLESESDNLLLTDMEGNLGYRQSKEFLGFDNW